MSAASSSQLMDALTRIRELERRLKSVAEIARSHETCECSCAVMILEALNV